MGLKMVQSTARVVRLVLGCQQGVLDDAQRSDVLTAGRDARLPEVSDTD